MIPYVTKLSVFTNIQSKVLATGIEIFIIILFALIFYLISIPIIKLVSRVVVDMENSLKGVPVSEMLWATLGLILGLIIAFLLSQPLKLIPIPYLGLILTVIIYGSCAYLGLRVGSVHREELNDKFRNLIPVTKRAIKEKTLVKEDTTAKVLDTSVIIDGRVKEIALAGFLEGKLIVPVFVLEELQHIADSADSLKRNRGRRGLDILKAMQDSPDFDIEIFKGKYEDIKEVDSKLLKLTQELNGKIVTNDYNLNKVAVLQNIPVLNINELANAVKPVFLPGEEMEVAIVKEGKEHSQGLGYLDDGTMIVVENGKKYLGETITVIVTSILQTSAGKMIFAKPKN